jgi:hypothetical protein
VLLCRIIIASKRRSRNIPYETLLRAPKKPFKFYCEIDLKTSKCSIHDVLLNAVEQRAFQITFEDAGRARTINVLVSTVRRV